LLGRTPFECCETPRHELKKMSKLLMHVALVSGDKKISLSKEVADIVKTIIEEEFYMYTKDTVLLDVKDSSMASSMLQYYPDIWKDSKSEPSLDELSYEAYHFIVFDNASLSHPSKSDVMVVDVDTTNQTYEKRPFGYFEYLQKMLQNVEF